MRKIIKYPNPILSTPTKKVEEISPDIVSLIDDMKYISNQDNVLGVAANQLGESLSILVAQGIPYINPEVKAKYGKIEMTEGCLSFPEFAVKLHRAKILTVSYLDEDLNRKEVTLEDLAAIVLQHEIDHLNGITFIDRLSNSKRPIAWKKYLKLLEND